jgi:hypothetical protein
MIYKCAVIFTCALLLLVTAETNGEKRCNARGTLYPREIWNFWTGYLCYDYTNTYRLNFKYEFIPINLNNFTIPGSEINETTYFVYDYLDEHSLPFIQRSFKTQHFFEMWRDCAQEAVDCCDDVMNDENIYNTTEYPCPTIWDGWSCFSGAKAGTIQELPCSKQAYSTESDVCLLMSEKECFSNGTWNQKTNYDVCAIAPVLRNRHNFNVIVLATTTVISFPSVVIFFTFRKFRQNLRLIFHRNLVLVIIIRNLLTIMTKEIIILDALKSTGSNNVMDNNGIACRVLAFFENAAKNGMYACMLADGFYLHKMIVRAFANEPNLLYVYAAVFVLTFLPSLIWATARATAGGANCWMVDDSQDQWIPDGFRIAILAINFIFLIDIIRVMALKLKRGKTSQQTRATLKATLFLMPLFGVQIVIITNRNIVTSKDCQAEDIYYYISYLVEGLQGVMVAILFCYINQEIRKELKNAYRKFLLEVQVRFGINLNTNQDNRRRTTAATSVDPY